MKLATSINSFEETPLDIKIFGKIMRENEHVNIGKTNRLAKLFKFSQPPLQEQISSAISENKNDYEMVYNVIHSNSSLPIYAIYSFNLSDLREFLHTEYVFNINKLRGTYSEYNFKLQELREVDTVCEEYKFSISDLRNIETTYTEYIYLISSLRESSTVIEEYKFSTVELRKPTTQILQYIFNISELRKPTTQVLVYKYSVSELRKPLTQVLVYKYSISELRKQDKLTNGGYVEPQTELSTKLEDEFISTNNIIVNKQQDNNETLVKVELNNANIVSIDDTDDLDILELLKQQENSINYSKQPVINSSKVEETEDCIIGDELQEKIEISEDVSVNNSPDSIINTESNNITKENEEQLNIPTDLVKFVKMFPRCDIEFALNYFSKAEIDKAIKIAKVSKRKNKLYL